MRAVLLCLLLAGCKRSPAVNPVAECAKMSGVQLHACMLRVEDKIRREQARKLRAQVDAGDLTGLGL